MKQAVRTGKPVLVAAETTPTVAVMARPDGLLSMTSNVFPVRAKIRGVWKSINPRLRKTAGGSWSPAVASTPVTFSGGRTGPLVTVADAAGQTVSVYWPAALPRPVINGSIALYRNVLAGVDLRMKATGTGYQETLVVHNATAASDPALRSLSFRVRAGRGLALRRGPHRSLGVVDRKTGKLVFAIGQAQLWDSSRTQSAPAPQPATADTAGSGRPAGSAWTGAYAGPMDAAIAPAGGSVSNATLREIIAVTSPGSGQVRIQLSNAHGSVPVTFDAATIGAQSTGPATVAAPVALTFGGSASVTIPAGADVYSDPVASPGGSKLVVSLHIPASSTETSVPVHETPNSTTFYATGNQAANSDGTPFTNANSTLGEYYVSRIDVSDSAATGGTVAVLGDQTAMAAPAFTFGNWASDLPAALQAQGVALPGSVADVASGGTMPAHWWRMNGTGLDTAITAYDSGSAPTASLTLGGTAAFTADTPATDTTTGALSLDGTSGFASTAAR